MLLPDNINPENCIYYNGALVLNALQNVGKTSIWNLYSTVTESKHMSFSIFILCLDWLYIINVAQIEGEEVVLCS